MEAYDTRPTRHDESPAPPFTIAPDRKRFQSIEGLLFPVLAIDTEGTIQHVSKAARRLLEYSLDETIDPYFFSHVHGKNLYRVMQDVAHMVRCGQQQASWLVRLRTGRGRWRWYRAAVRNRLHQDDEHILIQLSEV